VLVLVFLMLFGASPAGTGGGLKTTSFAALLGLVRSTLKGRKTIRYAKRQVPPERLQAATAGLAFYGVLLFAALFLLLLTEPGAAFEAVLFEAVSAMGTVGLSLGLTGGLSDLGKITVTVLMIAGRVGILTFGIALARRDESREEERDNELVI
jgi:trk system potassium uptake protein TrkH